MVPPTLMLATKNGVAGKLVSLAAFTILLAGCMPTGPRALLDGKRLLDAGHYAQAVDKFKIATSLLQTNAQAWNYLGLAYHHAGQPTNAVAAYCKALMLNRNLAEARFNLGCLWLEHNRPDLAKEQFTTYTLLPLERRQTVEGLLKLGAAQFRLRETTAAEQSFQKALRLSEHNPEALNGLGLAQLQRNRVRESAQYFNAALKYNPTYRPALLNLATVLHRYLNDPAGALQKYREYLALKPPPPDRDTVNLLVQSLEQRTAPPVRPTATVAPPHAATVTSRQVVANNNVPKPQAVHVPPPAKSNPPPPATVVKSSPAPAPAPVTTTVVKLPPEAVIKATPEASPAPTVGAPAASTSPPPVLATTPQPAKRSFWQWLNPFHRNRTQKSKVTKLPEISVEPSPTTQSPKSDVTAASVPPSAPSSGDRAGAERAFAQGVHLQEAKRLNEAAAAFKQATQLDARYFEAYYHLGLVTYLSRNYRQSLAAWENALAVRPDSTDARYNFALTLNAANHPADAARELEKVLAANPNETRAHLVLGNLYAEALHNPAKARAHYLKVLELNPSHPQGAAIHYWLVANPP